MKKQRFMNCLKYWPGSRYLLMRLSFAALFAVCILHSAQAAELTQAKSVSGMVSDEGGTPIPGVNILVKGTRAGTVTDADGKYTLTLPDASSMLVFSYIGYVTREIIIGNQTVIDVVLMEDMQRIDEVIVVGYGTQRKKDLTGSIASVSGEALGEMPALSFDQALQGKVAGVQITQTTGAPGGNVNVIVRGISSITGGTSPLYVVDGFPIGTGGGGSNLSGFASGSYTSAGMAGNTANKINPLSTINPSDIESIEILKDASATAIYGSRGANGVIIITTKKGKFGKSSIDFHASYGLQQVQKKLDLMNPQEYAAYVAEGRDNAWIAANPAVNKATDPNEVRTVQSTWVRPEYRNPAQFPLKGTDWQDVIFRTAPVQNYQLSATGGTENIKYLISGGYFNQEGIVIGSNYERFSIRSNIDVQLTNRIKLGSTVSGTYGFGDFARTEGHLQYRNQINCALAFSPIAPVYNADGTPYNELTDPLGAPIENPINIDRNFSDKRNQANMLTNNYLEIQIIDGLIFRTSFGVNYTQRQTKLWKSSLIATGQATTSPATASAISQKGISWLNENTLNYRKLFRNRHDLNVLAGYTAQKSTDNFLSVGATNFPTDYIEYVGAGTVDAGNNYDSEWSLLSVLARVNYVYDGKYMLTATVRRDGSSRFPAGNKWGTFPSVSVAYRISEEAFMQNVKFVSNLKLRLSYGESGNNLIGNYAHIGLLSPTNYARNNTKVPGLAPSSMSNDALTWEKSRQTNIGLDIGLFNDRITFVADVYRDYKKDLLLNVSLPAASGFGSSMQNIGEIENKGVELGLNTDNILTRDFQWSTGFNISANRNEVKKLATEGARITNSTWQVTQVGYPIASFYLMRALGVFKDQADVASGHPLQHPQTQPGDLKFKDVDGNGVITTADKEIIGSPWPDYIWGLTNTFSYKGFSLNIFINGSKGNKVFYEMSSTLLNSAGVQNQLAMVNRRWKSPENPGDGLVPRAIRSSTFYGMESACSRFLFDGSFVRIKDITLSYDFKKNITNVLRLQGLNAYFNVSNLWTFTDYPGYDPEASTSGDSLTRSGIDEGVYPLARAYTLGVKLSF